MHNGWFSRILKLAFKKKKVLRTKKNKSVTFQQRENIEQDLTNESVIDAWLAYYAFEKTYNGAPFIPF